MSFSSSQRMDAVRNRNTGDASSDDNDLAFLGEVRCRSIRVKMMKLVAPV